MGFDSNNQYEAKVIEEIRERKVKYRSRRSRLKRYMATFMAAILIFSTVYALVLDAITLESSTASTMPGIVLEDNENGSPADIRELTPGEVAAPAEASEEDSFNIENQPVMMGGDLAMPSETGTPAGNENQLAENTETGTDAASDKNVDDTASPEEGASATDADSDSAESVAAEGETKASGTDLEKETADTGSENETVIAYINETTPLVYEGEDYRVVLTAAEDAKIPAGAVIAVSEIPNNSDEYAAYLANARTALDLSEDEVLPATMARFFDITILSRNIEIEPQASVKLEIALVDRKIKQDEDVQIVHEVTSGVLETPEVITDVVKAEDLADSEIVVEAEAGEDIGVSASFETDSFSVYGIIYTVDFEYEINGEIYDYSLPGGGFITLRNLVEVLGIIGDTNFESADEFVRYVDDVEFSDPELVKVTKITEDTVIEFSKGTGDGEDELWAVEEPVRGNLTSAFDIDPITGTLEINAGDWLLESLAPFTSTETLIITFLDGSRTVISVTDEAYGHSGEEIDTESDGTFDLIKLAHIQATTTANTTDIDWDAELPFQIRYDFSDSGIYAIIDYINETGTLPTLVYNFSSVLESTALDKVIPASYYLSTGYRTVGKVDITADGKATFTFTDREWLESRNSLRGTFDITLVANPDKAEEHGTDTVEFPASGEEIPVTYKKIVSNSTKNLNLPIVSNSDGSYTLNYTAYVDANGALDTLHFTDTMTGLQSLVADSVKVNGIPVTGLYDGQNPFSFEVGTVPGIKNDAGKIPSGRYSVTYSTVITAAQIEEIAEGGKTVGDNTTHWVANGTDVEPDGHAEYEITKPVTPVPVEKTADKSSAQPGEEVSYTVTVGDSNTSLAGLNITDSITDIQQIQGNISIAYGDNQTVTVSPSPNAVDTQYSLGMVEVFNYTFADNETAKGPVTITYKTKLISEEDAKKSNVFGNASLTNTAVEHKTNHTSTTTTQVTYPPAPEITVEKTASVAEDDKNEDGTWKPGAKVTYTITIDSSDNHDLSNLNVNDSMSFLQSIDVPTAKITVNGTEYSLGEYISLVGGQNHFDNGNWNYTDSLFSFRFPDNTVGPVTITYTTTVLTEDEAIAKGIYNAQNVNNTITVGNKSDSDGGTVPYPEEPKFPVEKTALYTDKVEGTNYAAPGAEITYTVSYSGSADFRLDGARLYDEMTDIQKLKGLVTVTLDHALLRDITWPDGTVWEAGNTSFTMPYGSSQWAEDGVVWQDYFDDGQYHLNENVRVYCLTLPNGTTENPSNPYFEEGTKITVTYTAEIITEAEALAAGITDLQNAYNHAMAGNGSAITTVPVQFPPVVTHEPAIEKKWVGFDFDRSLVYWEIHVTADIANGSTYPLEYVSVYENVANNGLQWKNEKQGVNFQNVAISDLLLTEAVVTTDSGVVLQPGDDYTIDKLGTEHSPGYEEGVVGNEFWMDSNNGYPSFSFRRLEEGVTIRLAYGIRDNNIINGFWAKNTATVTSKVGTGYCAGKEADADTTYETTDIEMTKNGSTEAGNPRVIKWTVRINPSVQTCTPDLDAVIFDDTIPEGLRLINFSSYINNGTVDLTDPSFRVSYSGIVSGTVREFGKDGYTNYRSQTGPFNYNEENPNANITATVSNSGITNANIAAIDLYNNGSNAYMSGEFYKVEYYTFVDDNEWDNITSSLAGLKTYVNTGTVKMRDGEDDLSATGSASVSITEEDFIDKQDVTVEDQNGVVIDQSTQSNSNYIKYEIEINRNAMKLVSEQDARLTMSDRISTNMDLDPDTFMMEFWDNEANDHAGGWVNIKTVKNQPGYDDIKAIAISYNDDSRYLIIDNIPDETRFRINYGCIVRSTGTDTFRNTAVLTGGGSHSSSTEVEHTVKPGSANIFGGTNSVTLVKIDENDIGVKLQGVQFEVYECFFDEEKIAAWQYQDSQGNKHFDYNKIEAALPAYGTSLDPANLTGDTALLYEAFQVQRVVFPMPIRTAGT